MIYPIRPVPKPRMSQRDKWMRRPCVLRYRAFADKVRLLRVVVPSGARVVFHLPMPASWPEKRRAAMEGTPHQCTPDLDNLAKALLDALHADDAHVHAITLEKRWARAGAIEVEGHS